MNRDNIEIDKAEKYEKLASGVFISLNNILQVSITLNLLRWPIRLHFQGNYYIELTLF